MDVPIKLPHMRRVISLLIIVCFTVTGINIPLVQAQDFRLPTPGVMVHLSPPLNPPILKGIKVHPDNPFRFDFILDKGDSQLSKDQLRDESSKLIKYFLASLTMPEKDLWVNLSPYEKDRIIPNSFGVTEMGRDLLAEDYMLKQITASLIYPEDKVGKKFWERIYQEAAKRYGTTNIPVNTFNKVWIVPEKAVVYENTKAGTAYVVKSKLKVMLEQDYLSLAKHEGIQSAQTQVKDTSQLGSEVVREIVIPELTKEVNEDKNFVQLRQVYNSLILAVWYKKKIKDSILEQVYADKKKIAGVTIDDPRETEKIYQRYLSAFKKGVYNYIKEEVNPVTQETLPRKYFSGGVRLDFAMNATNMQTSLFFVHDPAMLDGDSDNKNTLELSFDLAMKSNTGSERFRTFMEYSSSSLGRDLNSLGELELMLMWPLYSFEVDRKFAEVSDYRAAYKEFYDAYAKSVTRGALQLGAVQSYAPIIKRPFSTVQEVKDVVNIDTEWSIDFLTAPENWKGPTLYNFILCVMGDGQLHMSFYDGDGLIREFKTDQETEKALREIGVIDGNGLLVLVRSSLDDRLKNNAVPGIGNRIGLAGHSHPKGSNVVPSQTNRMGAPADVELFHMKWMGLPTKFPTDRVIPALAQRPQPAIEAGQDAQNEPKEELAVPDRNLPGVLSTYIERLEAASSAHGKTAKGLPIDELVLYLKVLNAMYEETIAGFKRYNMDHEYVHLHRAEFAGELAYHPRFQVDARDMLRESFVGAFRLLAQNFQGSFDSSSSLDEMMGIMSQLVEEASTHPELREMALNIINDPKTYGLEDIDLSNTDLTRVYPVSAEQKPVATPEQPTAPRGVRGLIGAITNKVWGKAPEGALVLQTVESPSTEESTAITPVALQTIELAVVSNGLIVAAEKSDRNFSYGLSYRAQDVIRARTRRLLIMANNVVNDDPQLAESCLREYLRLLTTYGDRMKFYVDVTLHDYSNIMTNANVRPTVLEIVRSIPERDDRTNTLAEIALQFIREGDLQGALNLLKEAGVGTFSTFADGLEIMIDRLLVPKDRNEKMIKRLVKMVEDIPNDVKGRAGEHKVRLFVRLAGAYDKLDMKSDARSYYTKAWEASGRVAIPAMIRLEYFVPLMRKKGIKFPVSRDEILQEVRVMAENDLNKPYPNERPDKMIALGREYAFNRDYQKAEEAAKYINDHMSYPRDHYDHVYGSIVEAAALYGDDDMLKNAASKMTNYKTDHLFRAAQLLVDRGDYVRAMEIGEGIVSAWELTQIRIASFILDRDTTQVGMVRTYLEKAIEGQRGLGNFDLEDLVNLIANYPALDPDGQFILRIFKIAFEKNRDGLKHWSQRIILKNLRRIIMARAHQVQPSLSGISEVFGEANRELPVSEVKALPAVPSNSGSSESEGDKAQMVDYGGIDLTPANMNLQTQNNGGEIKFHVDPAMLQRLQSASGFVPVNINIQPLTNIKTFLGLNDDKPADGI